MSRPRLVALLLAFATLVVFLPAARFAFLNFDDNDYVTENAFVKNGLTGAGLQWAFTAFHAGNWHPLTWLTHMLDCELFQLNAGAHHFVNVLWHAANVALLFALLWRLTARLWPAALIAALFAWHPLHVESVAWLSERKDVLSTCFALLSLLAYAKYAEASKVQSPKSKVYFGLSLTAFALGLLAKPMLVTLPFVLLLLDYWPLQRGSPPTGRNWLRRAGEKWPFFLLTAGSCVVTFFAQRQGEAVVSLTKVSLVYRLENAPLAVVNYVLNLVWPTNLCALYPLPGKISASSVVAAVVVLALTSIVVWRQRRPRPYLVVGWLWFLGTLVPVIGLVQVGGQAMADRYTYLPSIGFFLALVLLAADFAARIRLPKPLAAGIAALILAGCVLATERQLPYWRDSETLFRRALAVTQNNDIALVNLGAALDEQNRPAEALAAYRQALSIEPGRYQLHSNLGRILSQQGHHLDALAEYRAAVRLRPGNAVIHNAVGSELAALGRFSEALAAFAEAERLDPNYPWPHVETAKAYLQQGRDADAVAELRAAFRLAPENFQILAYAARVLAANENAAARDGQQALALAVKANVLTGGSQPFVFDALGMAFAETGDFTNAQTCAQNALDLATAARMKALEPLQKRLELYKNRQPWRESFRATNAPAAQ